MRDLSVFALSVLLFVQKTKSFLKAINVEDVFSFNQDANWLLINNVKIALNKINFNQNTTFIAPYHFSQALNILQGTKASRTSSQSGFSVLKVEHHIYRNKVGIGDQVISFKQNTNPKTITNQLGLNQTITVAKVQPSVNLMTLEQSININKLQNYGLNQNLELFSYGKCYLEDWRFVLSD